MTDPLSGERRRGWALRRIAAARHRHMLSPPPITVSIEQLMRQEMSQIRQRFAVVAEQPEGATRRDSARQALCELLTSGHSYVIEGVLTRDSRRLGVHTDTAALLRRPFPGTAQASQLSYLNSLVSAQLLQTLSDGSPLFDDAGILGLLEPDGETITSGSTEIELIELVAAAPGFDAELGAIAADRVIEHHRQLLGVSVWEREQATGSGWSAADLARVCAPPSWDVGSVLAGVGAAMCIGFTRGGGFGGLLFPRETKFLDAEAVVFLSGGSAAGTARALRRAETIGNRTGGRFIAGVSINAARAHSSGHELLHPERVGMVADVAPEALRICHTASRSAAERVIPDPLAPPARTDFHAAVPGAFDITDIAGIVAELRGRQRGTGWARPRQVRVREAAG